MDQDGSTRLLEKWPWPGLLILAGCLLLLVPTPLAAQGWRSKPRTAWSPVPRR